MRIFVVIASVLLSSAVVAAGPPLNMKPGLWEQTMVIKSQSGRIEAAMAEMRRQFEQMPAEQRRMMEQMMQGQGMFMNPGGTTMKICVTEEEIARGVLPEQDGCTQEVLEQSRDRLRFRFSCSGDTGEGEMIFHDSGRYSGKATLNTKIDGQTEAMIIEHAGKWLSGDCGGVEPAG